MGYLEALRESIEDGSGWDKMGRPRPTQEDIDAEINRMSITDLLFHIDAIDEQNLKGF
jgi:hypothetical protein